MSAYPARRVDAFLDARAAGIEEADDRARRYFTAICWTFTILEACARRERAAEHGEVFREHVNEAPVDRAPAGDDAVAGDLCLLHAEFVAAVFDEHVELFERAFIQEKLNPLARR